MQGLTGRQREILEFITKRIEEQGYPPTIREIGEHMGIKSTNGVNDHLKALERKGFLKREGLKSRALRPVQAEGGSTGPAARIGGSLGSGAVDVAGSEPGIESNVVSAVIPDRGATIAVPVLGRVAAGAPILADEHPEATVHIDSFFLGGKSGEKIFALRVTGDSMIEAGILDGDYIFVRKQLEARRSDIVVAMIDGEATVKRFEPKGDVIHFVPENSSMDPIVVRRSDFRNTCILGVVVGVYRNV